MRVGLVIGLMTVALASSLGLAASHPQEPSGATTTKSNAAALKNPVPSNAKSIADGGQLFTKMCASCHGATGKGDGKAGALLKPKPADLTDAMWLHGSTDGEIYTTIHDGVAKTGMRGFSGRLTTNEIWAVVNYVRSIGPPKK